MRQRTKYVSAEPDVSGSTNLFIGFIAGILFGALGGYILGAQSLAPRPAAVPTAAPAATTAAVTPSAPIVDEQALQAYRNILASDPRNLRANVELGNKLYDAGRYGEAVPYYRQALAINPRDINVSTDLGTALWYAGDADAALAQFDKSLAIDAKHPHTLFNIGIVRLNGKSDPRGAIRSWETLLASNPSYADAPKVEELISDARSKLTASAPAPATSSR